MSLPQVKNTVGPGKIGLDALQTVSVIGKGSYAKVLLVKKKSDGKLFALKVIKKQLVSSEKQFNHLLSEKQVLNNVKDLPFVVHVHATFQSPRKIFFLLDYCPGGDLFSYLQLHTRLSERQTKFIAAQLVVALEAIHGRNVVYRDLKPENIIIDHDGYVKLTDFGLSKVLTKSEKMKSICGTPEYLAPEMLTKGGYGQSCDWWALGCVIYEMVTGMPPFFSNSRKDLFESILQHKPKYPSSLSPSLVKMLDGLLEKDFTKRLGSKLGAKDIKNHFWFIDISWEYLKVKNLPSPLHIDAKTNSGLANFDKEFTKMPVNSYEEPISSTELHLFTDFSWAPESLG